MKKYQSRAMAATLKSIRSSSPMWRDGEWQPREAGIMWAIWLQAVQDAINPYNAPRQSQADRESAQATAEKGIIHLPDGRIVNALELIGIDSGWAWGRVCKALHHIEAA